jgi:hypothetical protein
MDPSSYPTMTLSLRQFSSYSPFQYSSHHDGFNLARDLLFYDFFTMTAEPNLASQAAIDTVRDCGKVLALRSKKSITPQRTIADAQR